MSTDIDSASHRALSSLRVQLNPLLLEQEDGRCGNVDIPARTIVLSLAWYFLKESVTSLNALDQQLREPQVQQTLGLSPHQSSANAPIVSDSTIRHSLEGWCPQSIRRVADWMYGTLRENGLLGRTLPSGRRLSIGVLDSSSFGDCYSHHITALTDSDTYPLDLQAHDEFKRGKEPGAAREMIPRWRDQFELFLLDGLYLKQWVFDALEEPQTADALVKYPIKEDRDKAFPWPLQQARFAIKKGLRESHTIHDDRYDEPATGYRVSLSDCGHDLLIDRFSIDGEDKQDFFTVTTRTDLSPRDTWELSHSRWAIENNGFRALSLQNDSKDQNPKGGRTLPSAVKYTLLFWLLLFQGLFRMMAVLFVSEEELKNVKVTESWLYSRVRKYLGALLNGPRGDP
ncbi:MAG: hypothetical protein ABEJ65_04450 [bacterium]